MALNQYKYGIEFRDDDAINRNQILFDFMQLMLIFMDGLYMDEKCVLIDTIKRYQWINQSAVEVERLNRDKKDRKKKKVHLSLLPKRLFCE